MIIEKQPSPLLLKLQELYSRSNNLFIPMTVVLAALTGFLIVKINQPLYILLGIAGLLAFFITVGSGQSGLLLLIFISYTRFSDVMTEFHNSPSIAKPYLVILVLSILIRWGLNREPPKGWQTPTILFGLLMVAEFASVTYSPVPAEAMGRFTDDVKDVIIAVVIAILMQTPVDYRRTIWVVIAGGIFLCTLSVYQYFTGTYDNNYWGFSLSLSHTIIGTYDDFRATGPIGDPNFYAQIIVILIPISLERFLHEKQKRYRILALWSLVASTVTVIVTYSRGGFLAMIVGTLVFFLFYPPKRNHLVIIMVVLALVYSVLPRSYMDRMLTLTSLFQDRGTSRNEERSLQGRLSENLAALEMIKDKPFFGVGIGSFKFLFPEYSKRLGIARTSTEREAHNTYLEIFAETGIAGFIIFSFVLGSALYSIIKSREAFAQLGHLDMAGMTVGFLGGFIAYFFAAIFVHNAFPRHFYMLLGIALAIPGVVRNLMGTLPGARSD